MKTLAKPKLYSCYLCKEKKSPIFFYKDSGRKAGVCSVCKNCESKRKNHKKYLKQYAKKYPLKEANLVKLSARQIMSSAIKKGDLVPQACKVCGKIKTDGHHYDYSKPLDVIWLCRLHHSHVHKGIIII